MPWFRAVVVDLNQKPQQPELTGSPLGVFLVVTYSLFLDFISLFLFFLQIWCFPPWHRVTKEVDATSKEAKSFFKQNEKEKPQAADPAALPSLPAGSGWVFWAQAPVCLARWRSCFQYKHLLHCSWRDLFSESRNYAAALPLLKY